MKQLSNSILVSAMTAVLMFGTFAFGVQEGDSDSGSATAEKSEAKQDADSPAAKFKAIQKEVNKISSARGKKLREIRKEFRDDDEKMSEALSKLSKESEGKTNELLVGVLDIAKMADEDSKMSLDAISFLMSRSTDDSQKEMASDLLIKHHIDNPKLARKLTAMTGRGLPSKTTKSLFDKIIANSENDELKGYAALSLADHLMGLQQYESIAADDPAFAKRYPDVVKYVEEMKEEAGLGKLKIRFNKIAEDYEEVELPVAMRSRNMRAKKGDMIGKLATKVFVAHEKKVLAKLRVSVGKEAPEIEGPDIDGESFKLSDYRGKVVLLDFWGDW